ncbi:group 1 truncated hemoglobin [Haliea sp.]|uniref:group I truncated hemoglobin n=1 Tax=Haliea sp. TaxID=1932666 RepID=UPI00352946B1
MSDALKVLLACTLLAAGCTPQVHSPRPLYTQLGGQAGIDRIVDGLLWEIAEDAEIRALFADTDIQRFRNKLAEQLCAVSDGPCVYTGDSMRETHRHLAVTSAQFNRLVDDLIRVMEQERIAVGAQNALLQRLAAMHGDIVAE